MLLVVGLGGSRCCIPSVGGHNPTRVGRLVGEAEAVAEGAAGYKLHHTPQEAVAGVAAAVHYIAGGRSKRVWWVDQSSVIDR